MATISATATASARKGFSDPGETARPTGTTCATRTEQPGGPARATVAADAGKRSTQMNFAADHDVAVTGVTAAATGPGIAVQPPAMATVTPSATAADNGAQIGCLGASTISAGPTCTTVTEQPGATPGTACSTAPGRNTRRGQRTGSALATGAAVAE
ncbi:hypothetical protein MSIMFI_01451 [Mycobacterium simulans]|nr:hypothetical protein MSIMFI_01451 [Mycobacterium simulans]